MSNATKVYFNFIDGLRAIAVSAVILYHANSDWLPGGFMGVDLFFVISGFVVALSIQQLPANNFKEFLSEFYARRVRRIFPALLVCLLISSVMAVLFIPSAWLSNSNTFTGLAAFFGVSNIVLSSSAGDYFSPKSEFNPFTHTWSLAVEEQFYLILPPLIWFWMRLRGKAGSGIVWAWLSIAFISVISLLMAAFADGDGGRMRAFYLMPYRFWELGAGVMLALALPVWRFRMERMHFPRFALSLASLSLLCLLGGALELGDSSRFPWPWAIAPVALTAMLIFILVAHPFGPVYKLLSARPLLYTGKISYSLYLWHWPVIVLLRWTVGLDDPVVCGLAIGLSAILGALSYHLIELPIRHRATIRISAPRWVATGLVAAACGAMVTGALAWSQPFLSLSVTADKSAWYPYSPVYMPAESERCNVSLTTQQTNGVDMKEFLPTHCWRPTPIKRIWVAGDSHAGAYEGLFHGLVRRDGYEIRTYLRPGCSFLGLKQTISEETVYCRDYSSKVVDLLKSQIKPGDVVFLPSLRLFRLADQWGSKKIMGFNKNFRVDVDETIVRESIEILQPIVSRGVKIVFEAPKPIFASPAFRCSDWFNRKNPICHGGLQIQRDEVERMRSAVIVRMNKIQARLAGVSVWDPLPLLCPEKICSAFDGADPLYFDGDHISGHGNAMLFDELAGVLRKISAAS